MPSDRRNHNRRGGSGGPHHSSALPRSVLVSKALSRLLRHAAVQERIPIDSHGYVRVDHLLAWQRLRSMNPPVTMAELVEVVQENEKKRFALKVVVPRDGGPVAHSPREAGLDGPPAPVPGEEQPGSEATPEAPPSEAESESETQRAISVFQSLQKSSDLDLGRFFLS